MCGPARIVSAQSSERTPAHVHSKSNDNDAFIARIEVDGGVRQDTEISLTLDGARWRGVVCAAGDEGREVCNYARYAYVELDREAALALADFKGVRAHERVRLGDTVVGEWSFPDRVARGGPFAIVLRITNEQGPRLTLLRSHQAMTFQAWRDGVAISPRVQGIVNGPSVQSPLAPGDTVTESADVADSLRLVDRGSYRVAATFRALLLPDGMSFGKSIVTAAAWDLAVHGQADISVT